jgi:hypothetical protein
MNIINCVLYGLDLFKIKINTKITTVKTFHNFQRKNNAFECCETYNLEILTHYLGLSKDTKMTNSIFF